MLYLEAERTGEMRPWLGEEEPVMRFPYGQVYTSLGPFTPNRLPSQGTLYTSRIEHCGRHQPHVRWGQLRRWARSVAREAAEFLIGAFQPIRDAV